MSEPATRSWQLWRDRRGRLSVLRLVTLALLLMPLAKAVFEAGQIAHGARPLNELIHRAGFWALVFLGVTLAVTPFRRIIRYGNLADVRRMLGSGHSATSPPTSRCSLLTRATASPSFFTRSRTASI
jgi:sulfoxide reductase heme-binding subunit YedZ